MKTRIEIIKARFKDETAPPDGTFKDLPIKDCMAIYADQYAKKCLDLLAADLRAEGNGKISGGKKAILESLEFYLPNHD